MEKIIYIVDFDNTLVKTNESFDIETKYKDFKIEKYNYKLYKMLNNLSRLGKKIYILTMRPPSVMFKIYKTLIGFNCEVICIGDNEFDEELSKEEEYWICANERKVVEINRISNDCDMVFFIDDGSYYYLRERVYNQLNDNVILSYPNKF